jgi:hypothetical protein
MRTSIVKIGLAFLCSLSAACFGADLTEYEKTCLDLGFKKRTPAYGECVLELDKRATADQKQVDRQRSEQQRLSQEQQQRQATLQKQQEEQQRSTEINRRGDGTADHQTCYGFGLVPGTAPYSDCRLRMTIAKREAEQRQAAIDAEQRRYETKLAAEREQKEQEETRRRIGAVGAALSGFAASRTPPIVAPLPASPYQQYVPRCVQNPNGFDCPR